MNKKITEILSFIDSLFPDAKCELFYSRDYELVIAVMLSAQSTDKSVNKVTTVLFDKYDNLSSLANAQRGDIEDIIKSIGLYKNKANNIIGICQKIITDFNGTVPSNKDLLQTLPGVGNKTAGVIRAEYFKIPDLPVDTHILRICYRLGITNKNDSPLEVETKLKKLIPEDRWIKTHHQLIHFGRYFCLARKPKCEECQIKKYCRYFQQNQ